MTDYAVGIDRGSGYDDSKILSDVVNALKKCSGGNVVSLGVGPNKVQAYGLTSASKGKTGVYIANGVGLATPNDMAQSYYHYDHVVFVWPQWINNQWMSDNNIQNHIVRGEHDWNRAGNWNVGGQTAAQWFGSNSKVDLVAAKTAEEVAQRICNKAYVTSSGNPSSAGSSSSVNGTSSGSDNVSPLLKGEMTFEELVGEICNGIDLMFLCKRSTVVVTDFSTIFAEAKYLRDNNYSAVSGEDIKLYQLDEDSYELNIDQHGFYNTVYVEYDKGIVKETFNEFVRSFGEVAITYKEPKIDKTTAIMKAKAYLAAHLRDFEMEVKATILTEPDIDIGDIVTLENPQTMHNKLKTAEGGDAEYLFVKGVNTSWEGDGMIESDLELQFSPTSPAKKEVPTAGTKTCSSTSGDGIGSGNTKFNKCGLSGDGKIICAIGKPSASGESQYGNTFYRSLFKNECPFCGGTNLVWGIFWAGESGNYGYLPCKGSTEGGSAEGHVFCKDCDADFSCILGKDHMNPPRETLTRADGGPVQCTKNDAYSLRNGTYSC